MKNKNLLEKTSYDNELENTTINDVILTNKQTILELNTKVNKVRTDLIQLSKECINI